MRIEELEKISNRKVAQLVKIYAKVPRGKRRQAYKIYLDLGRGKITYEEALEKLRKMAKG